MADALLSLNSDSAVRPPNAGIGCARYQAIACCAPPVCRQGTVGLVRKLSAEPDSLHELDLGDTETVRNFVAAIRN
jgi:hypothetical protein